jgi:Bacteriophage P2-related tail formation protein
MSRTIYEVSLLELLPSNLRDNPDIIAASQAVDPEFQTLAQMINKVLIYPNIDNLDSKMVDYLALETNADFYDQFLPIENRKALVRDAYIHKYYKGTAYAVKQIIEDAFIPAVIQEWFQYNGQPYHFRIYTGSSLPSDQMSDITTAINAVKNVRSHLDSITAIRAINNNIYYGIANRQFKYTRLSQK